MVQIFAGRDAAGAIRYIGEVAPGSACGCSCMVCSAPLVAKQGHINEWHFAHASGQQQPECLVGARNLIRSVALEFLREMNRLPVRSEYTTTARAGAHARDVAWDAHLTHIAWAEQSTGPGSPAAVLELEEGQADLYLAIEGDDVACTHDPQRGRMLLNLPLPHVEALRSREALRAHVVQYLHAQWLYLPDFRGVLESARSEVRRLDDEDRFKLERWQRQRAQDAGRRWAKVREGLERGGEPPPPRPHPAALAQQQSPLQPADPAAGALAASPESSPPAWASGWKSGTGLFCLSFRDGSRWLLYEGQDCFLLRPWESDEGWDEALPPSLGVADEALGAYRVKDFLTGMMGVRPYMVGLRNTYALAQVPELFEVLRQK